MRNRKLPLGHCAIKTMKNNKSGGPDGMTAEIYKCIDDTNLIAFAEIMTDMWNQEKMPNELAHARVASIYKKGDPRLQSNYRPISLLNVVYKLYVKVIRSRIAAVIDKYITKSQYGFRQYKSTSQAIHIIRRLGEYSAIEDRHELCLA